MKRSSFSYLRASSKLRYLPVAILISFSINTFAESAKETVSPEKPKAVNIESKETLKTSLNKKKPISDVKQSAEKLPPVILKNSTPLKEKNTKQNAEKTTEMEKPWYMMSFAEVLSASFMLALVVFTGLLALSTHKLWRVTRDSVLAAKKSADAASTSANAAIASVNEMAFSRIIANPPKLIVRCIYTTTPNLDESFRIDYEITNIGGSAAEVIAIHADVFRDNLPIPTPYGTESNVNMFLIHAGEYVKRQIIVPDGIVSSLDFVYSDRNGMADKIYVMGYVVYQDDRIRINHRTAFCRVYDSVLGKFTPMSDPDADYEHAD